MKKKFVSLIIAFSLLLSVIVPGAGIGGDFLKPEYRNGFMLEAQDSDETGININSSFNLYTETDYSLEEITSGFSITGEPNPDIKMLNGKKFVINLTRPLLENSIYNFILKISTKPETLWTFQTRAPFSIIGSLPGNKMNNAPLILGIEIYFSHFDFEDAPSHFEIFPSAKGTFEVHDKTLVFVPEGLMEATLYTVTIKKGIKISGTDRTIDKDYIFTFETQKTKEVDVSQENKGQIFYGQTILDVTTKFPPQVPISYWINDNVFKAPTFNVKTSVYAYNSFEKFSSDFIEKQEVPSWAYYNYSNKFTATDNLNKIMEFSQEFKSQPEKISYDVPQTINIPNPLPLGYYVLDSYWEDIHFQSFLQITNTGIYITNSQTKTLVWLNDMISAKSIAGASVTYDGYSDVYTSDNNGIVYFDTKESAKLIYENRYLKIMPQDGIASILCCTSSFGTLQNSYWQHLQTDRNLYKPDDQVKTWGFIKNRYKNEDIKNLTLELSSARNYRFLNTNPMPIVKKSIDVINGFYSGQIDLPNLEQGGYILSIKKDNEIISSTYINVQKYTKPSYKIDISSDKKATFPGTEVNFNIKTAFFEGTGVSNLQTDAYISDWSIGGQSSKTTGKTDVKGNMSVKYVPIVNGNYQGEASVSLDARATLPESGEIRGNSSIRIFINDVDVELDTKIVDGMAKITADVKNVVLDRLNNGTAKDYQDYLGAPVANKNILGKIYKNVWKEVEDGVYYDFINKVSHKKYRYELAKTVLTGITMTTNADGIATFEFPIVNEKDVYYTTLLQCDDNSGNLMAFERFFWEYNPMYDDFISSPQTVDNSYRLDGGRESYKIGDSVDLTFKKGTKTLPEGKYLYVAAQNGIQEYWVSSKPTFHKEFTAIDMPNTTIFAVNFYENSQYNTASFDAKYNFEERNINIVATLDKPSYKPGETVKISVDAKDIDRKPVAATINARIVDEALLKLSEHNVEVLPSLYDGVNSGINFSKSSHNQQQNYNIALVETMLESKAMTKGDMANAAVAELPPSEDMSAVALRQEFKDTAYYSSINTDMSGHGEITFKLPDNVTSWRVSLDAISNDLHAGSNKLDLKVSLPFFINYSFNSTYLVGDKPVIGVNAYGDDLSEGQLVMFEVSSVKNPATKVSAVGKAFERTNIPLWKLDEGDDSLIIKAYTNSGLDDSVKHAFQVVKSYYQIRKNNVYDLKSGISINGGKDGNTHIIFADKGRGQFLSPLLALAYPNGNRVEQKVASTFATKLLNKYFNSYDYSFEETNFDAKDYQKADGGISLMTYGESELKLSARLTSHIKDSIDSALLRDYFYEKYKSKTSGEALLALWGLASLKEPVIIDLDKYSKLTNLTIEDAIVLALAYCEIGEISKATALYNDRISKSLINQAPYTYVEITSSNNNAKDNSIDLTALASILASKLNSPHKTSMFKYVEDNVVADIFPGLTILSYIDSVIQDYSDVKASFVYNFNDEEKSVNLANGNTSHLKIPSTLLPQLKFISGEGDVSAVSMFKEGIDSISKVDENLKVSRKYYHIDGKPLQNDSVKQGDVIKVQIDYSINSKALDGEYEITDYLPSGLKPTDLLYDSGYYYRKIDGQKVTFNVYNTQYSDENSVFEYYARIITPGTYWAQGTIIQNIKAPDSINHAPNQILNIDSGSEIIATPLDPNGISVHVNERNVVFDATPFIDYGRTMVPMRSIFEVLGATVIWDAKNRTVTGQKGDNKIVLTIDSNIAIVNGAKKTLDVPAKILSNRTFVPTRFISESLGASVKWDAQSKTVLIN